MIRHPPVPFALDALDWLARDHAILAGLFDDYEQLRQRSGGQFDRASHVQTLVVSLSQHMQLEEDIFYPAARTAFGPDPALDHALLDHGGTLELIDRIDRMRPEDPDFDAAVAVLRAYAVPHMGDEEQEIFPRLRSAGVDTIALGVQIAQRLEALALKEQTHGGGRLQSTDRGRAPGSSLLPPGLTLESPPC